MLPIIGLGGRMDWGVHAYSPAGNGIDPRNGGIVGTVSYDTTRNELDPQYAAVEDWQPGVSGVPVRLYEPVPCGTTSAPCDADGRYELDADGSYAKGRLLNTYVTETWARPTGCTARDVDGNPLVHGVDEKVLATNQETDGECISSFMQAHPVRSLRHRPGHARRQLRRGGGRQLRVRRRLLHRQPGRHATRTPRSATAAFEPLPAGGLPGEHRDPGRRQRPPDVQGDRRGGHQHRQRRPDRPPGAAAGVRGRAAHRRPGRHHGRER